jgi:acyl-CoA synthetase (AMP-forming)/AMP-acid ligase II
VTLAPALESFRDLVCDCSRFADQDAIVTARRTVSWGALADLNHGLIETLGGLAVHRVGLCFRPIAESFGALAALDALAVDTFLLDGDAPPNKLVELASRFALAALVIPLEANKDRIVEIRTGADRAEPGCGSSTITILTSGTTGISKAARHTWSSLSRPVRRDPSHRGARWLLTYRPNLYAGLQVILQGLINSGTVVVADPGCEARAVAELMLATRVDHVSATPSYWRWLLLLAPREIIGRVKLTQITLGGEVADQQILDALKLQFPAARLAHVYATTELGRCFSVTDGKAGFPASFLSAVSPDGIELRDDQGELLVRSANAMKSYDRLSGLSWSDSDWIATGDLIEQRGDRVYFVGRKTDLINVGGNKVHPTEVEGVVREVPGVADVIAYGEKSSIVGELVACDVVPRLGQEAESLRTSVDRHCAARLAPHQRPRFVHIVDTIPLSHSGKKKRRLP